VVGEVAFPTTLHVDERHIFEGIGLLGSSSREGACRKGTDLLNRDSRAERHVQQVAPCIVKEGDPFTDTCTGDRSPVHQSISQRVVRSDTGDIEVLSLGGDSHRALHLPEVMPGDEVLLDGSLVATRMADLYRIGEGDTRREYLQGVCR